MLKLKKETEEHDGHAHMKLQKYKAVLKQNNELLDRLTQTEAELQRKIVVPEQLKSLNEIEEQLIQEQNEIKGFSEDHATTAKCKQEDCEYYAEALNKTNSLNFDCFSVLHDLKHKQAKIKEMERKCVALSEQIKAVEVEIVKVRTKANDTKEKKQHLLLQREKLKADLEKNINDEKIRFEAIARETEQLENKRKMKEKKLVELEDMLKSEKAKKDLLIATFEEQYKRALEIENKQVKKFNEILDHLLESNGYHD